MKKTYGVYGLIEYEMSLPVGDKQMRASFEGGSISQYGIVPATYTTSNEVVQYMIEQSAAYRSKRVVLVKVEAAPNGAAEHNRLPQQSEGEAAAAPQPQAPPPPKEGETEAEAAEVREIEVSCMEDAVEELRAYGYKGSKLTTRKAVDEAAAQEGIRFVYKKQ